MHVLWKSILTGFGMKIGSELAKSLSSKVQTRFAAKNTGDDGTDEPEHPEQDADEELPGPLPDAPAERS